MIGTSNKICSFVRGIYFLMEENNYITLAKKPLLTGVSKLFNSSFLCGKAVQNANRLFLLCNKLSGANLIQILHIRKQFPDVGSHFLLFRIQFPPKLYLCLTVETSSPTIEVNSLTVEPPRLTDEMVRATFIATSWRRKAIAQPLKLNSLLLNAIPLSLKSIFRQLKVIPWSLKSIRQFEMN